MLRSFVAFALLASGASADVPKLTVVGQPVFGGDITVHVVDEDDADSQAVLAVGLDPLAVPVTTNKGDFWIGSLASLVALPKLDGTGKLGIAATLPPLDPIAAGIPVVCQAFVSGDLSSPATIPLDPVYAEPSAAELLFSPTLGFNASFGDRHAVGDLNDDGHQDIAVTAWRETLQGELWAGQAYVFFGPDFTASLTIPPRTPHELGFFGTNAVIADVNADGVDDLLLGEPYPQGSTPPAPSFLPAIHVHLGGAGFSALPSFSIKAPQASITYSIFGRSMAIGDLDNDGHVDVAVGVPNAPDFTNEGRVEVYRGPDFSTLETIASNDPGIDDFFGTRVAVGDVDGDGDDDLVSASSRVDVDGVVNVGRIEVFDGPVLAHVKTIDNPNPQGFNSRFGQDVVVDDFDGDGLEDVATTDDFGRAFIFWAPDFDDYVLIEHPDFFSSAPAYGLWMTSGDVNDDGHLDLLISDVFNGDLDCPTLTSGGVVYASLGPYFTTHHRIIDKTPECGAEFGWQMTLVDIDGDGREELVTGAVTSDLAGVPNAGHVTIFDLEP